MGIAQETPGALKPAMQNWLASQVRVRFKFPFFPLLPSLHFSCRTKPRSWTMGLPTCSRNARGGRSGSEGDLDLDRHPFILSSCSVEE